MHRYQSNLTNEALAEHRERLEVLLRLIEDEKASQIPQAAPHHDDDRATIKVDFSFAVRRYVHGDASITSQDTVQPAPSMQVSSYMVSDTLDTAQTFYTAKTGICTQLFIRDILSAKTMIFQVEPEQTIGQLKKKVRDRLQLPDAAFELAHSYIVLENTGSAIQEYNLPQDATLICISFRPHNLRPGTWPWELDLGKEEQRLQESQCNIGSRFKKNKEIEKATEDDYLAKLTEYWSRRPNGHAEIEKAMNTLRAMHKDAKMRWIAWAIVKANEVVEGERAKVDEVMRRQAREVEVVVERGEKRIQMRGEERRYG